MQKWPIRPGPTDDWVFHGAYTIFNDPASNSPALSPAIDAYAINLLPSAGTKFRVVRYLYPRRRRRPPPFRGGHVALVYARAGVFYSSGHSSCTRRSFSWGINDRGENSKPINISMTLNGFSLRPPPPSLDQLARIAGNTDPRVRVRKNFSTTFPLAKRKKHFLSTTNNFRYLRGCYRAACENAQRRLYGDNNNDKYRSKSGVRDHSRSALANPISNDCVRRLERRVARNFKPRRARYMCLYASRRRGSNFSQREG